MNLFASGGVLYQGQPVMLRNVSGKFVDVPKRVYASDHLHNRWLAARAWLAQSRVPVSVRCGMAERLFLASREQHRE